MCQIRRAGKYLTELLTPHDPYVSLSSSQLSLVMCMAKTYLESKSRFHTDFTMSCQKVRLLACLIMSLAYASQMTYISFNLLVILHLSQLLYFYIFCCEEIRAHKTYMNEAYFLHIKSVHDVGLCERYKSTSCTMATWSFDLLVYLVIEFNSCIFVLFIILFWWFWSICFHWII